MKVAYADPPYVGQAQRHYGMPEVDHVALLAQLEGYDAWAFSASSPSLRYLLPLCPETVRVMAWVKPFASFKPNVNPAYAWEPILVQMGRKPAREEPTVRDWVSSNITLRRGLAGAKPLAFCYWLFEVLNLEPDDDFHDLFPGTMGVTEAWTQWRSLKRNEPVRLLMAL